MRMATTDEHIARPTRWNFRFAEMLGPLNFLEPKCGRGRHEYSRNAYVHFEQLFS
jgi:hypothetical protein